MAGERDPTQGCEGLAASVPMRSQPEAEAGGRGHQNWTTFPEAENSDVQVKGPRHWANEAGPELGRSQVFPELGRSPECLSVQPLAQGDGTCGHLTQNVALAPFSCSEGPQFCFGELPV